jgi:pilus assembly protein CpaB
VNLARLLLVVVALGIAGLTAFLVRTYLSNKEAQLAQSGEPEKSVAAVEVLVADRELAAGTIVQPDAFRWQPWPGEDIHSSYVLRASGFDPKELAGAAVKRAIAAGEPVGPNRFVKPGEAGFLAGALTPGMRAISIKLTPVSGAAGFVQPGNHVDLLLTRDLGTDVEGGARRIVSETVLENVRVLAIDQSVNDVDQVAKLGDTATLEVTPRQAELVAAAIDLGKLSLALRSLAAGAAPAPIAEDARIRKFARAGAPLQPRVLVALRDLPAGALLRDTDLGWAPSDGASVEGLIVDATARAQDYRGAYLKQAAAAGQPIAESRVIRPNEQGFLIAALSPGLRAVSIAVTQVSGVSGFVAPGDRVDVIMTHQLNDTSDAPILNPRRFSETIVEDARLLAIEQTVDPATGKPVAGQTATLEVAPKQAEALALGASMGSLTLTLRSVPSVDSLAEGEEPFTSDLYISEATVEFVAAGTANAPQLVARRGVGFGQRTIQSVSGPQAGPRAIRVYRASAPSVVQVK